MEEKSQGKIPFWLIGAISLVVPLLVAFLFFFDGKLDLGNFVYELPHFHGVINSLTSLVLIAALVMVRKGNIEWHKNLMTCAVFLGAIFLISYVTYHSSAQSVIYGDVDGNGELSKTELSGASFRGTYLIILLTHIVASVVALPLVLVSFFYALTDNFKRHKRLVKFAYPIWLFVSVSGVTVYLMMRPYYF